MARLRDTKVYRTLVKGTLDEISSECMRYVKSGKNVNRRDLETGETYLHLLSDHVERFCCQRGVCVIYIMACKGVDLDIQDHNGDTFLHRIMRKPNTYRAMVAVIRCGADTLVKNNDGQTPEEVLLATKPCGWQETYHWFNKFKPGLYRAMVDKKPDRKLIEKLLKYLCRTAVVKDEKLICLKTMAKQNIRDYDLVRLIEKYENSIEFALSLLTGKDIAARTFFEQYVHVEKCNIDLNVRDYSYQYKFPDYPEVPQPLLAACWEGEMMENVEFLMEMGVNTSVLFSYHPQHCPPKPLFFQLVNGLCQPSDEIVHRILVGSDLTDRNPDGQTILFEAIDGQCSEELIIRLFGYGVNIAARDKYGRTARMFAELTQQHHYCHIIDNFTLQLIKDCNIERIEALIVQGYYHLANLQDKTGKSLLALAKDNCSNQLVEVIKKMDAVKIHIATMFSLAKTGSLSELRKLLGKKYACALDKCGRTILHIASLNNQKEIVNYLIKNYPSLINIQDNLGRSSLHYSELFLENDPLLKMIVELGGNMELKDVLGRTPADYRWENCGKRTYILLQKEVREMMMEVFLYETNFDLAFYDAVQSNDVTEVVRLIRGLKEHGDINRYSNVLFTCLEKSRDDVAVCLINEGMRTDIYKQYEACDPDSVLCAMVECDHTVTSFRDRAAQLRRKEVVQLLHQLDPEANDPPMENPEKSFICGITRLGTFANI